MLHGLHAVRGIAALLVALFHLQAASINEGFSPAILRMFRGGSLGVDIFFVLSGFIIYYVTSQSGTWNRQRFIIGRFLRIYPMYLLVLFATVVLYIGLSVITDDPSKFPSVGLILTSATLVPSDLYVLSIAWTLSVEMIFYLIFSATFKKDNRDRWLITALIAWSIMSVVNSYHDFQFFGSTTLLNAAVPELLFGVIIAKQYLTGNMPWQNVALIVGTILLIGLVVIDPIGDYEPLRPVIIGIPAMMTVYGATRAYDKLPKLLEALGDGSYVLYLIHIPFFLIVGFLLERGLGINFYASDFGMLAVLVVCVASAIMIHRFIERPFQKFYKSRWLAQTDRTETVS